MIRAVLSIGTNSTRVLVADLSTHPPKPLLQRSIGTRIGEGLSDGGRIGDEPMRRTLDAVREHCAAARELTDSVAAIATSAVRRAQNANDFAQAVFQITRSKLQVVSGEDEARYSYAGAVSGLNATQNEPIGVADPGGGSTEYAVGLGDRARRVVSCEIGAVRLTEMLPALAGDRGEVSAADVTRAYESAYAALEPIGRFDRVHRLVFVGGTATSTVALMSGSREPFTYRSFAREDVGRAIEQLRSRDLPARKTLPAMNPQRADILLAGLIVVDAVFARSGQTTATVSTNDLLLGYLLTSA